MKKNKIITFFDRMRGSFSTGPQNYYRKFKKKREPFTTFEYGANRTQALSEE